MSDEDRYYADLVEHHEASKPIGYEDSGSARYKEHEWEQEDER